MNFSDKLKELRTQKGLSQAALAQAIHISRSAVAKWENGLGLPAEDSLQLLCQYFGVSEQELLPDKDTAQQQVAQNKALDQESKMVIGFACGAGIGLFLLAFLFIPPLREHLTPIGLGVICMVLGAFNLKGNIASIHWYNRRKVSKEDQLPYCRTMGLGTVMVGASILLSSLTQVLLSELIGGAVALVGVLSGFVLMLYAQFKYNKGIF